MDEKEILEKIDEDIKKAEETLSLIRKLRSLIVKSIKKEELIKDE